MVYNLALATDRNYLRFVAVVLASLYENNRDADTIIVHLLLNDVPDDLMCPLERQVADTNIHLKYYSVSDIQERFPVKVSCTLPITTMARLFLASILPPDVDRVLYVDCDTIFVGSISELFDLGLDGKSIAGVLDTPGIGAKTGIGLADTDSYVNAGVLLINLDFWRIHNLEGAFLEYIINKKGSVVHNDQGVINALCKDSKKVVGPQFNMQTSYYSHPYGYIAQTQSPCYSEYEIAAAKKHPVIIHFTEGYLGRPWRKGSKHPMAGQFLKYKEQTAWAKTPLDADNRTIAIKVLSWFFLNTPIPVYKSIESIIGSLQRCWMKFR